MSEENVEVAGRGKPICWGSPLSEILRGRCRNETSSEGKTHEPG
jgi:hypothetical protein